MDLGRPETNERILNLNRHGPCWIAESAQLAAFGEDLTSREDVYAE